MESRKAVKQSQLNPDGKGWNAHAKELGLSLVITDSKQRLNDPNCVLPGESGWGFQGKLEWGQNGNSERLSSYQGQEIWQKRPQLR